MIQSERRCFGLRELRTVGGDTEKIIEGHAAVFDQKTNVDNMFWEVIERNAFADADSLRDVALFINHDIFKLPIARSRRNNDNSSMTLAVDDVGLAFRARLDVDNNPDARALYSAVERGDISGMSFAFDVAEDDWADLDSDMPTRRVKKIAQVFEISACNFPAYEQTDIYTRAAVQSLTNARNALDNARAKSLDVDKLRRIAVLRLKNRILGGF